LAKKGDRWLINEGGWPRREICNLLRRLVTKKGDRWLIKADRWPRREIAG
jgi:hypothetical protein